MQLSQAPAKIVEAFAINAAPSGGYGGKRTVPVPSQTGVTPGAASFNDGFPPLTMTPILSGGVVMSGLDMNGALNQISAPAWWANSGAGWLFDSVFAAAVGGYPKGARVLMASGTGYWLNLTDNNSNDPDTGGAGWIPFGTQAKASVVGPEQTLASGTNKVIFGTVEFDAFGLWDAADARFQALWAGVYRVSGAIYIQVPGSPQNISIQIYKNGALIKQPVLCPMTTDQSVSVPFSAMVSCDVGDYLEIYFEASATSVTIGSTLLNNPYLFNEIEYLGT